MTERVMIAVIMFLVDFCYASSGSGSQEISCGEPVYSPPSIARIVGGETSDRRSWPWQAMLMEYSESSDHYSFICGGTLISNQWIVTASHCINGMFPVPYYQVVLGAIFKNHTDESAKAFVLDSIYCHQDYIGSANFFAHDICLLKLPRAISFTDYIRPACLPEMNSGLNAGDNCQVTGWGDTKGTADSSVLQEAMVGVISRTSCENWYGEIGLTIPKGHFCAGHASGGIDACQGDSGGPLVCRDDENEPYTLHGVVSFGYDCGLPEKPGVYTNVSDYMSWIEETVLNSTSDECFEESSIFACESVIRVSGTLLRSPVVDTERWLYPSDTTCSWYISTTTSDMYINLEFICFFHLEKYSNRCVDFVYISDGQDESVQSSGFVVRVSFVPKEEYFEEGSTAEYSTIGIAESLTNQLSTTPEIHEEFAVTTAQNLATTSSARLTTDISASSDKTEADVKQTYTSSVFQSTAGPRDNRVSTVPVLVTEAATERQTEDIVTSIQVLSTDFVKRTGHSFTTELSSILEPNQSATSHDASVTESHARGTASGYSDISASANQSDDYSRTPAPLPSGISTRSTNEVLSTISQPELSSTAPPCVQTSVNALSNDLSYDSLTTKSHSIEISNKITSSYKQLIRSEASTVTDAEELAKLWNASGVETSSSFQTAKGQASDESERTTIGNNVKQTNVLAATTTLTETGILSKIVATTTSHKTQSDGTGTMMYELTADLAILNITLPADESGSGNGHGDEPQRNSTLTSVVANEMSNRSEYAVSSTSYEPGASGEENTEPTGTQLPDNGVAKFRNFYFLKQEMVLICILSTIFTKLWPN